MTETLAQVAHELELSDPDLLKLARTDVEPRAAVEALRTRFPGAFRRPFDARTASPAEAAAAMARIKSGDRSTYVQDRKASPSTANLTLAQAAAEFELIDFSVLALARSDAPPREAMAELRKHYPQAFKAPFDARTASPAERAAGWAKLQQDEYRRHAEAETRATYAKLEKKFGKKD